MKLNYYFYVCEDCYSVHHFGEISEFCQVFGIYSSAGPNDVESMVTRAADRNEECQTAMAKFGPNVVDATNSETGEGYEEFGRYACSSCRTPLHGGRWQLAALTND